MPGVQAKKAPAKKAPALKASAPTSGSAQPSATGLSAAELAEIRARLQSELVELQGEYEKSLAVLNDQRQAQADGTGEDQADAASTTFEREQEQSIAANRQVLLDQVQHAIERIEDGSYGVCEDCGKPIPRARLRALPMATLDAACKARAEHH